MSLKNRRKARDIIEKYHREADYLRKKGEEKDWRRTEEFCYALVDIYQMCTGEVPMIAGLRAGEPTLPAVEFAASSEIYEVYGVNVSSGEEYVRRLNDSGDVDEKELSGPKLLQPRRHRD